MQDRSAALAALRRSQLLRDDSGPSRVYRNSAGTVYHRFMYSGGSSLPARTASVAKTYKKLPPQETLWECFDVILFSGKLVRKPRKGVTTKLGTFGAKSSKGYIYGMLNGQKYYAHRLMWVWFNGPIPQNMEVDHIDRNRSNNTIYNLRLVTKRQQSLNTSIYSNNKSGFKGVVLKPWGSYVARIRVNGVPIHLGSYKTAEEAHCAYIRAAQTYFGEYSCAG